MRKVTTTSLSLPTPLLDQLKAQAAGYGMSVSSLATMLLRLGMRSLEVKIDFGEEAYQAAKANLSSAYSMLVCEGGDD